MRLFCNVSICTDSASALIHASYHMRFVIQHVRELWCMQFLSFWCCSLVSSYWSGIESLWWIGKEVSNRIRSILHVELSRGPIHSLCNKTHEILLYSRENLRLTCTNPTIAIGSLSCGMRALASASNYTREKATRDVNLAMSCTVSSRTRMY